MGVRTYEVTVSRKFIVKGCSNKKQVEAKAPEQLRQGEYVSEITEVKPVFKELPMPDVSAVTSSRKRQPKPEPKPAFEEEVTTEQSTPLVLEVALPTVLAVEDIDPAEDLSKDDDELEPGEEKFYENVTEVDFKNKVRK